MTDIGELNLNLDLKAVNFEKNLQKAEKRASESGSSIVDTFDLVESAFEKVARSADKNLSEPLKKEAKKGREALEGLFQDDLIDFSSLGNVDLSPLTNEIERIKGSSLEIFAGLFSDLGDDFFSRIKPIEVSVEEEPSERTRSRRGRRRQRPTTEDELEAISGRSRTRIEPDREGGISIETRPVAADLQRDESRRRSRQERPSAPESISRPEQPTQPDFADFEPPEITLPDIDTKSLEAITDFLNQVENIDAASDALVGFIDAWNDAQVTANLAAESYGLTQEALDSIIQTIQGLSTDELDKLNDFFNQSADIDDTSGAIEDFRKEWNKAVSQFRSSTDAGSTLAEQFDQIAVAANRARQQVDGVIHATGRITTGNRLARGAASVSSLFDQVAQVIEPRFKGGVIDPGKLYSVAEKGTEIGKFSGKTVIFDSPMIIRPKATGRIFSSGATKTLLQQMKSKTRSDIPTASVQPKPSTLIAQIPIRKPSPPKPTANLNQADPLVSEIKALRRDLQRAIALSGNTYMMGESGDNALDLIANIRAMDTTALLRRRL